MNIKLCCAKILSQAIALAMSMVFATAFAADPPSDAWKEKAKELEKQFPLMRHPYPDAQGLMPYLKDSDPRVRQMAYATTMTSCSFTSAEQLLTYIDIAMAEQDPTARQQALNSFEAFRVRSRNLYPGVDPVTVPDLERVAMTNDPAGRLKAINALGMIQARAPKTYITLLRDKDTAISIAAIRAAGLMMDDLQGSETQNALEVAPVLIDVIMNNPKVLDEGGLALYGVSGWLRQTPTINDLFAKFGPSKDLDERAVATMVRLKMNWSVKDWGVSREQVAEGVKSRFSWVRAVATDAIFRTLTPIEPIDGRAVLITAVGDQNSDVAHDAALRLCDALSLNIGNLSYKGALAHLRNTTPTKDKDVKSPAAFDSKEARIRTAAVQSLESTKPQLGVITAVRLFGDPDTTVAQAARKKALELIGKYEAERH